MGAAVDMDAVTAEMWLVKQGFTDQLQLCVVTDVYLNCKTFVSVVCWIQ